MGAKLSAPQARKTLAGVVGAIAAALLLTGIPREESGRTVAVSIDAAGSATVKHVSGPLYLKAYLDLVRVPTACDGITKGVKFGHRYTEAQCAVMLEDELVLHAEGLRRCAPQLWEPGRDRQRAAAVSWTYNVGIGAACGSTAVKRFRARQWAAGCDAITMWNKAGGRVVRGLVLRRARERDLCLTAIR
jgi:lysozyme